MSDLKIALVGGSGLGQALGALNTGQKHQIDTPFGPPSNEIIETEWAGLPVLLLSRHGPGHLLNPTQVPSRANIFALKQLGCTHIIASGAVGSLREEFRPRDLVIPDQIIDKTARRPGSFFEHAAVHVEFAEPFCPVLRQTLIDAGKAMTAESDNSVHDRGCYVCMEGPAFSTRAESLMHRLWGGDLIGMTAMPEAKLAREAEISYALVALVTDYDCWRNKPAAAEPAAPALNKDELLREIIGNLQAATDNALKLIRRAVQLLADRRDQLPQSPAHRALELAIWSDKTRIAPEEVQRLSPLWMKYF
jgi:5'-methylthioadenosine phosphorylase